MTYAKNLIEALIDSSKLETGITFIYSNMKEEVIKYNDLLNICLRMLNGFKKRGILKGDEVVFQVTNNKDFVFAFWACILGGIIPVPVTTGNSKENGLKLIKVWKQLKNPNLITSKENMDNLKELLEIVSENSDINREIEKKMFAICDLDCDEEAVYENVNPNDIAYIQFSSGSTGDPKGVMLTHKNLIVNVRDILNGCDADINDISLSWMPLTHDMGLIGMHISPLVLGIQQYNMIPSIFVRRPMLLLDKITEHKINIIASPNFGYLHMLNKIDVKNDYKWDLSSVKTIFNGAEIISYDICTRFLEVMSKYGLKKEAMFDVYGMAEASLAISFPKVRDGMKKVIMDRRSTNIGDRVIEKEYKTENDTVFVEVGTAVDSCSIRITDANGNNVGDRIVGNIKVKGENVTNGYYLRDDITNEVISADGWLDTGDIGFFRNEELVVIGRSKDMIIVNGQNYYSTDLERIVEKFSENAFKEVAVVGDFVGDNHEKILVFTHYRGNLEDYEDISEKVRLGFYHEIGLTIDEIIPVKKMPKTTSGKVQHFKLREEFRNGIYDEIVSNLNEIRALRFASRQIDKPINEVEEKIIDIFKKILQVDEIGVNDYLFNFFIKSIQVMQIFDEIDKVYHSKINVSDMFRYRNIKEIASAIQEDKKIEIGTNKYPIEFYCKENQWKEFQEIEYIIGIKDLLKLSDLAKSRSMEINEVIVGLLLYLFWEISQESVINVSTMLEDSGFINNLSINFDDIEDLNGLFLKVKNKSVSNVELNNIYCNKSFYDISMLILNTNFSQKIECNNMDIFDIIWEIIPQEEEIVLAIKYDVNKIYTHNIEKFIKVFEEILIGLGDIN